MRFNTSIQLNNCKSNDSVERYTFCRYKKLFYLMNIITDLLFPKSKTKSDDSKSNGLPVLDRNPRGIHIKSAPEIEKMRRSGKIVATVLKEIQSITKPGMTTADTGRICRTAYP